MNSSYALHIDLDAEVRIRQSDRPGSTVNTVAVGGCTLFFESPAHLEEFAASIVEQLAALEVSK